MFGQNAQINNEFIIEENSLPKEGFISDFTEKILSLKINNH